MFNDNDALMQTKFVEYLLKGYWYEYKSFFMWAFMVPYLCYMVCILNFLVYVLS